MIRRAVTDTGAQMNVLDIQTLKEMGIDVATLAPTTMKLRGAGRGSALTVEGTIFVDVEVPGPPPVRA